MYRSIIQATLILVTMFLGTCASGQGTLVALIHAEDSCDGSAHKGVMYKEVEEMPVLAQCAKSDDAESCTTSLLQELVIADERYQKKINVVALKGSTLLTFVVEPDGCLTNFYVRREACEGCGDVIADLIKSQTKWRSGKTQGRAVKVSKSFELHL